MRFLLDSNTCIQFLNRRSAPLLRRLLDTPDREISVCSVVKAELFYGAKKSRHPERSRRIQEEFLGRYVSLPFDDEASDVYAEIRAQLERAGTPVGANDLGRNTPRFHPSGSAHAGGELTPITPASSRALTKTALYTSQ